MKVLIIHNSYKIRGGEDAVFDSEFQMLHKNHISVKKIVVRNDHIDSIYSKKRKGLIKIGNQSWIL